MTALESSACNSAHDNSMANSCPVVADICREAEPENIAFVGLLGEYMENTRQNRLKHIINHPFMLEGFARKDVTYPWAASAPFKDASWEGNAAYAWIGEHVGKWLHAATVLALSAGDTELLQRVQAVGDELISYQEPDGYLGTYSTEFRMTSPDGIHTPTSWDIWTLRYNMIGLLTAHRYLPNKEWLAACRKIGDLLISKYGPGQADLTGQGTRNGLSALTILESVVVLYMQTGDTRYLEFAQHLIYESSEQRTRVLRQLLAQAELTTIGSGKAYQLMSVLLGVLELYRCTGDEKLKAAVLYAWQTIKDQHVHITGGPWSKRVAEGSNRECFATPEHWSPEENVETCSTVTWIQLSLSLFRLTGEAVYFDEAERALYNHLLGSQTPDGRLGAYFSSPNERDRLFTPRLDCCNSSRPRALAVAVTHAYTYRENGVCVNIYGPGSARLQLNGTTVRIQQETEYPRSGAIRISVDPDNPVVFPMWLRVPSWAKQHTLQINNEWVKAQVSPGSYICLNRQWRKGDTLSLQFATPVVIHQRHFNGYVIEAATVGPLVLACSGDTPDTAINLSASTVSQQLVPYYQASVQGQQVTTWFRPAHHGGDA